MLPQGLLFSSDQQVAEVILALLPEFGIEVEHRADVFSAIERLTGRPYCVLVIDWKEQLEASFLLKTARELTIAKSTAAVAIVHQRDVSGALKIGANAVLVKPFSYEQARSTFAACLQGAAPDQPSPILSVRQAPSPAVLEQNVTVPASATPQRRERRHVGSVRRSIPTPPSFAGYRRPSSRFDAKKLIKPSLWLTMITAAVLIAPHSKGLGNRFHKALQAQIASPTAPPVEEVKPSGVAFEDPSLQTRSDYTNTAANVRSNATTSAGRYKTPASVSVTLQPADSNVAASEPDPTAVHPYVPGSLMVSLQAMTARPAETKLSRPANTWSLEPTLLPEEAARQLLVRQVPPRYPDLAVATGLEGVVTLHAMVGKDGGIRELKLIRGSLLLGRSAFQAVKQWRYKPYLVNGEAVEMQTFITVNFVHSTHAALAQK